MLGSRALNAAAFPLRVCRDKETAHAKATSEDEQQYYQQQLADLKQKLTKALAGRQQLETRRALDVDGFNADIALLRKALTATNRYDCSVARTDTSSADSSWRECLQCQLALLRKALTATDRQGINPHCHDMQGAHHPEGFFLARLFRKVTATQYLITQATARDEARGPSGA